MWGSWGAELVESDSVSVQVAGSGLGPSSAGSLPASLCLSLPLKQISLLKKLNKMKICYLKRHTKLLRKDGDSKPRSWWGEGRLLAVPQGTPLMAMSLGTCQRVPARPGAGTEATAQAELPRGKDAGSAGLQPPREGKG